MTDAAGPAPGDDPPAGPAPGDAPAGPAPQDDLPVGAADAVEPAPPRVGRPVRTVDQVLARAHLRLGSLALARVELETLGLLGTLDTEGLVDLAEVRWRTGDLPAAGEAAGAVLLTEEEHPVALVIAAEAAASVGRPGEARRLATRAIERATDPIDAIFAGMPRAGVWPADAAEPPPTAGTLFHRETPEAAERSRSHDGTVGSASPAHPDGPDGPEARAPAHPNAPLALGFWDGDGTTDPAIPDLPDPAGELEAGRTAFVAGALDEAALRFGIAMRLAPALAPAVLEATDGARGTSLTMVRGDAYRLVGHEPEAQRAYAIAASGGLPERRRRPRPKPAAPAPSIATMDPGAGAEAPTVEPDPEPVVVEPVVAEAAVPEPAPVEPAPVEPAADAGSTTEPAPTHADDADDADADATGDIVPAEPDGDGPVA